MKKLVLFFLLAFSIVSLSAAQVSFGGGVHSGLTFATFDESVRDFYGVGFNGGIHTDLNVASFFSTRLAFDYNLFPSDKTKLKGAFRVTDPNGQTTNNFSVEGANVSIMAFTANGIGKIPTGSSVTPYGLIGVGLQIMSQSDLKVVADGQTLLTQSGGDSESRFGMNFGAGLEFALGQRTKLFVETKYVLVFGQQSNSSYLPVTLGVSF